MFAKLLIFVLLGSTLVLAAPSSETVDLQEEGRQAGWWSQIGQWWSDLRTRVSELMEKLKKTFNELINEQGPKIMELGKEKLAELEKKYTQLQGQAKEAIEKERREWDARIEQWKKDGGETLEGGKEKLEELKKQAEAAIQSQTTYWTDQIHTMEQTIKNTVTEKLEEPRKS